MDEIDIIQEKANEESYEELWVGEKSDRTKNPLWNKVIGLKKSVNILVGKREKMSDFLDTLPVLHIYDFYTSEIVRLSMLKKETLRKIPGAKFG